MRPIPLAGLLSATILMSTAAPSLSETLNSNPLPDGRSVVRVMARHDDAASRPVLLAQADFGPADDNGGPRGDRPPPGQMPDQAPGAPDTALDLAAELATAETYIGITSAQLDAWRAYATALIDLVEGPQHKSGPGGPPREAGPRPGGDKPKGPPPPDAAASPPADGPLAAERLAERMIEQGEKAQALKAAIAALRSALAPEQLVKLRDAERAYLMPPGPRGPHADGRFDDGRHRWHGEFPPPPPPPPPLPEE
jgi:hypothetical protein